jgi:hypothetical protein
MKSIGLIEFMCTKCVAKEADTIGDSKNAEENKKMYSNCL